MRMTSLSLLAFLVAVLLGHNAVSGQNLPRSTMEYIHKAAELANDAYKSKADILEKYGAETSVFQSVLPTSKTVVNQAILHPDSDACYVSFRGTSLTSWKLALWEMSENFNWAPQQLERIKSEPGDSTCSFHNGFLDAYMQNDADWKWLPDEFLEELSGGGIVPENSYTKDLETAIDECMKREEEEPWLIFTGHSQGGAIALIGMYRHIGLYEYNPWAITFAQPETLIGPCSAIDDYDVWRFVNSEVEPNHLTVNIQNDIIPYTIKYARIM